ncbi:MAG: hypothetical protein AAF531_00105 [Actinomycetota bacterium]
MTDEVKADTHDLQAFVDGGLNYVTRLEAILDTVRFRRSTVMAAVGADVGVDATVPFAELLAEATVNNRYVDTILVALHTHRFAGGAVTVDTDRIDAALAVAGLDLTGDDLSAARDQQLADRQPTGPVGDDALRLLGGWMQANGVNSLSADQLTGMVLTGAAPVGSGSDGDERAPLPVEVRQAARYLYQNPDLFLRVARMSGPNPSFSVSVSRNDIETTVIVNEGLRVLSNQEYFQAVDADGNGRITYGEVAAAEDALPPDVFAALLGVNYAGRDPLRTIQEQNVPIIELAAEAENQGLSDGPGLTGSYHDGVSYTDVVGAVINRHAFANDPDGAYRFVTQLPTSFDDLSGKSSGFDIRLAEDDALRALAGAALGGADGFVEQTLVVSYLPESEGGVRNLLITAYYAEIAKRMNHRLNAHLVDPSDPTAVGHSGAHWAMMAPHASNGVRPVITADLSAFGLEPSLGDRQAAADGNQYIFGTIGPTYAAFLDAFPPGREITEGRIAAFVNPARRYGGTGHSIFRPGQADMRDGFVYYAAAIEEDDPVRRQELVFTGNLLLATFEQAGAQHWIEQITDLDWSDDGWRALAQGGTWLVGGDEAIATDQMILPLGIRTGTEHDDYEEFRLARDVPARPGDNSAIIGVPLVAFDPTADDKQTVAFPDFTVGLDGSDADVVTAALGGWDNPPPGAMEALPTSVEDWATGGDGNYLTTAGGVVEEGRGTDDGVNLTGTGAIRWNDWEERQWYIANLFHQFHTDPALFDNLGDFTADRSDIHGDAALTAFLPEDALFELDGGGQR